MYELNAIHEVYLYVSRLKRSLSDWQLDDESVCSRACWGQTGVNINGLIWHTYNERLPEIMEVYKVIFCLSWEKGMCIDNLNLANSLCSLKNTFFFFLLCSIGGSKVLIQLLKSQLPIMLHNTEHLQSSQGFGSPSPSFLSLDWEPWP